MTLGAPGPLWSAQQREWLQALGHEVPVLATAGAAAPAPSPAATQVAMAGRSGSAMPPPLLQALARAAGRAVEDEEFLRAVGDAAALRGNPAARRALWPRLRTLRRKRVP